MHDFEHCTQTKLTSPEIIKLLRKVAKSLLIFKFCLSASIEFLEVNDYPDHIKRLVQKEKELEEQEKRQREIERNTCKVHPNMQCQLNRISV